MTRIARLRLLAIAALILSAAGCRRDRAPGEEPDTSAAESLVAVREPRLGRTVDGEGAVVAPADSFAPSDTVRFSLTAEGNVDRAVVTARWTRGEDRILVDEGQREFPLAGKMTVSFELAPPGGLEPGEYRVEAFLGGHPVAEERFRVVADSSGA